MRPILEFRWMFLGNQAINQSNSCVSVYAQIPKTNGLLIQSWGTGVQQLFLQQLLSFFPQRARRAVLPQEEEGSGAGQPVADFSKKEGNDHALSSPLSRS